MSKAGEFIVTETSPVVLDDDAYTIVSLCDRLSLAREAKDYVSECCAPCPSFTTVPCSC
ncbi:MAG: hypothetical protein ABFD97_12650 [Syntrophobacter sp.]